MDYELIIYMLFYLGCFPYKYVLQVVVYMSYSLYDNHMLLLCYLGLRSMHRVYILFLDERTTYRHVNHLLVITTLSL